MGDFFCVNWYHLYGTPAVSTKYRISGEKENTSTYHDDHLVHSHRKDLGICCALLLEMLCQEAFATTLPQVSLESLE